jgi:preprotein translocase subunit SecG
MGNFWAYLSTSVLMLTGILMIFIILLQRGRGGGLAGAFGGAGGQSALGTKAGDVFTRITVGLAIIWALLACMSIYALRAGSEGRLALPGAAASEEGAVEGEAALPGEAPAEDVAAPAGATGSSANAGGGSGATGTGAGGNAEGGPAAGGTNAGGEPANSGSTPAGDDTPADDAP